MMKATLAALVVPLLLLAPAPAGASLDPVQIHAATDELAELLEENYLFPDVAERYATQLRERSAAGAYESAADPDLLASSWESELQALHADAHLRVLRVGPAGTESTMQRIQRDQEALGDPAWIADGVAYLPIYLLPADAGVQQQMAGFLDEYSGARALILDLRACRGGTLPVMDVLFAHLFSEEQRLVRMDVRGGPGDERETVLGEEGNLKREEAPAGLLRFDHWTRPMVPAGPWAKARVFVLTDLTASACEHLAYSLKLTGRATLVGATTRGAGHFGGFRRFGGQFEVFVPVGRTYDPQTGVGWEGTGIAPDIEVAPQDAPARALAELGITDFKIPALASPAPSIRRVEANPGARRFGIGVAPPRGGEEFLPILQIVAGSIAAEAGLKPGDRILSLNGKPVSLIPASARPDYLRGSPLVVVVERDGQELTFDLSLEESPAEPRGPGSATQAHL